MVVHAKVHIGENFQKIIQSGNYEKLIRKILNESTRLLPNKFKHNEVQPTGECDFIDLQTGEKYDVKLLLTQEQGKMIGSRNANFEVWVQSMLDECAEFGKIFGPERDQRTVVGLALYKLFEKNMHRIQPDENAILFSPFPIVYESTVSFYRQFGFDILSAIFEELLHNDVIGKKHIYVIYPSIDHKIVLRNLATGVREFFSAKDLDAYIWYEI